MRKLLFTSLPVLVLSFAFYVHARPPSQGDPCAAGQDNPIRARLIASGDITKPGVHEVAIDSLSPIVIKVSRSWGGGKVTVPAGLIDAKFMIKTIASMPITPSTESAARELTFRITSLKATIQAFKYPNNVVTGENVFNILPEKSVVRVSGPTGVANLRGSAEATLTNGLFSRESPAHVYITFAGTYNFATRLATLMKIEAEGRSGLHASR